jgi:uncharacterized protein YndB with AHSA1/START domain
MPLQDVAPLEATIDIAAPPSAVWALLSDVRNMARWSPQVVRTFVRGGGEAGVGTRMFNINRRKFLFWPTQAKIVRFTPEKEIAFRIKENFVVWSYELEETATGTRVVARREAPAGISDLSVGLTKAALGGVEPFTRELLEGMNETLRKVKADAER